MWRLSRLRRAQQWWFSRSSNPPGEERKGKKQNEKTNEPYLLFPTQVPIFPYSVYALKINQHLQEYIKKNKITFACGFLLQSTDLKKEFIPNSYADLESFLSNKSTDLSLENSASSPDAATSNKSPQFPLDPTSEFDLSGHPFYFDESMSQTGKLPVTYIDRIDSIYPIGTICTLYMAPSDVVYLKGEARYVITPKDYSNDKPILFLEGSILHDDNYDRKEISFTALKELWIKMIWFSKIDHHLSFQPQNLKVIELLCGFVCTLKFFSSSESYELFRITDISQRVKLLQNYFSRYLATTEEAWGKIKSHYENFLGPNAKVQAIRDIYENLKGIFSPKESKYVDTIREKLTSSGKIYPTAVIQQIQAELQSILELPENSPDLSRKKSFINLIIEYPFGIRSKDNLDLQHAAHQLEAGHYGMKRVKQRILEFIAVAQLSGQFKCRSFSTQRRYFTFSQVLLLHGPPGVGKTSIAKSIANCLNRPYGRISLGGEYDPAILRGHRKTYIGAYPGKIFDTIYKLKVENPVILLDEIDKLQTRKGGTVQDAVLEILDPIQNTRFKDDFVEIQIDLSNVLFICTANTLETIYPALLDRMEKIEISGYTAFEKFNILQRFILKNAQDECGLFNPYKSETKEQSSEQKINQKKPQEQQLQEKQISSKQTKQMSQKESKQMKPFELLQESAMFLIQGYCREAGVRELERQTKKLCQKIALQKVTGKQYTQIIHPEHLETYLGPPRFSKKKLFGKIPPAGVMIGLSYGTNGGSLVYIEAVTTGNTLKKTGSLGTGQVKLDTSNSTPVRGNSSLVITGNLHEVMTQSCQLAYTYARYILSSFCDCNLLESESVHLNFPQIEIGKDGPSAGAAICCTFISLALNKPMQRLVAMTGEISLSGEIRAIGGLKEKILAAKRAEIQDVLVPSQNLRDVTEMEPEVLEGVTIHYVDHIAGVLKLTFDIDLPCFKYIPELNAQQYESVSPSDLNSNSSQRLLLTSNV